MLAASDDGVPAQPAVLCYLVWGVRRSSGTLLAPRRRRGNDAEVPLLRPSPTPRGHDRHPGQPAGGPESGGAMVRLLGERAAAPARDASPQQKSRGWRAHSASSIGGDVASGVSQVGRNPTHPAHRLRLFAAKRPDPSAKGRKRARRSLGLGRAAEDSLLQREVPAQRDNDAFRGFEFFVQSHVVRGRQDRCVSRNKFDEGQ